MMDITSKDALQDEIKRQEEKREREMIYALNFVEEGDADIHF